MTTPAWPTPKSSRREDHHLRGLLHRAAAHFAALGIPAVERVMTDNAMVYRRGRAWHQALTELGAQDRFTPRYRPQTNDKAERF